MAEQIAYLQAVVGADTSEFHSGMDGVRADGQKTMNFLGGIGDFGKTLTMGLTLPIVGAGAAVAAVGMEFDANMRNINSIVHLTQNGLNGLSEEVIKFGSNTRAGANEASTALYAVFSAGYGLKDTSLAMDLLEQSTLLSEAGLSDLERTTEGLTATMLTYGNTGLTAARATDVWAQMVGYGVGNLEGFLQNASKAMPAANALGISFENLGATAAYLSQGFASPNKAMTALGMLESNLMKPNAALALSYEKLGVQTGQELVAQFGSLEEAIIAVKGVSTDLEFANAFSKTGMEAALMLTNNVDQTRQSFQDFYATLDGAALNQWTEQTKSVSAAFDKAKSAVLGVALVLSQTFMPLLIPVFDKVSELANAFINASPEVHRMAVAFAALAAGVGPVIWAISTLIGSFSPIGLAFKVAGLAAVAFGENFMGVRDTIEDIVGSITGTLKPFADSLGVFFDTLYPETKKSEGANFAENILSTLDGIKIGDPVERLKVEKPSSLWDIYKKQGYDKQFSWQEFIKKVEDGGWDGGVINPGDIIHIGDPDTATGKMTSIVDVIKGAYDKGVQGVTDYLYPIKDRTYYEKMFGGSGESNEPVEIPFVERIKNAVSTAWPGIQAALGNLWTQLTGWFDSTVGAGLDFLGGLFSGTEASGGNTPVYSAVKALLEGDIYKAIDEIIPGAGTKLQEAIGGDWGAKIGGAFPQIAEGLGVLATNFSDWFMNDAIPTVAKSIGYFGGKVGVLIGQAIGAIGGFLSGAGDPSQAAGGMIQGVQDNLALVGEGFQEALTDSGVGIQAEGGSLSSWANQIVTGITGALGTAALAAGIWGTFSGGIWNGISSAMSIPIWFFGKVFSIGSTIATTLGSYVATTLGLPTTWAGAGAAIGKGIAAAYAAAPLLTLALGAIAVTALVTSIWMQVPDEVKASIQKSFHGLIDDAAGAGAGEALSRGLEAGLYDAAAAVAYAKGDTEGYNYLKGLSDQLKHTNDVWKASRERVDKYDDMFGLNDDAGVFKITYDGIDINFNNRNAYQQALANAKMELDGLDAGHDWMRPELEAKIKSFEDELYRQPLLAQVTWQAISGDFDIVDPAAWQAQAQAFLSEYTWEELQGKDLVWKVDHFELVPTAVGVDASGATVDVTGMPTSPIEMPFEFTWKPVAGAVAPGTQFGPALPEGGLPKVNADTLIDPTTPAQVTQIMADANTNLDTGLTTWGATTMAQVNNGNMSADQIKDSFLTPLEGYWTAAFGPEGPMALASSTFSTDFVTGLDNMGTSLINLNTTIGEQLALLINGFTIKLGEMSTAIETLKTQSAGPLTGFQSSFETTMSKVATSVTLVTNAVKDLANQLAALANAPMPNMPSGTGIGNDKPVNGSHAMGLSSVPFDGYIAELHKDEMVLTAQEARSYKAAPNLYTNNKTSNRTDNSTTIVNISGVQNVDQIMKEFSRRGIKIGR